MGGRIPWVSGRPGGYASIRRNGRIAIYIFFDKLSLDSRTLD
jgi:hypothetical protein